MSRPSFTEMIRAKWAEGKFVCVGLDSDLKKIPASVSGQALDRIFTFNREIVEATKGIAGCYKPNIAFYAAEGEKGLNALRRTINHILEEAPDVPIILDGKRGDIGNTNDGYVEEAFEDFEADAVTVHPYLGEEALRPFLDRKEKGIIVLCRTSNKGAGEFQDLKVSLSRDGSNGTVPRLEVERHFGHEIIDGIPVYQYVAYRAATAWNKNGNVSLVVGATYPGELKVVRQIARDMPLLIPGIGAQGGDLEKTVAFGKDKNGQGMIINSSRGIIFASNMPDFAEAAHRETQKLHDAINACRGST